MADFIPVECYDDSSESPIDRYSPDIVKYCSDNKYRVDYAMQRMLNTSVETYQNCIDSIVDVVINGCGSSYVNRNMNAAMQICDYFQVPQYARTTVINDLRTDSHHNMVITLIQQLSTRSGADKFYSMYAQCKSNREFTLRMRRSYPVICDADVDHLLMVIVEIQFENTRGHRYSDIIQILDDWRVVDTESRRVVQSRCSYERRIWRRRHVAAFPAVYPKLSQMSTISAISQKSRTRSPSPEARKRPAISFSKPVPIVQRNSSNEFAQRTSAKKLLASPITSSSLQEIEAKMSAIMQEINALKQSVKNITNQNIALTLRIRTLENK